MVKMQVGTISTKNKKGTQNDLKKLNKMKNKT